MERQRVCVTVQGIVQGVGFRPFVYRLAQELQLAGWVNNNVRGVVLEVEGEAAHIVAFRRRLVAEAPAQARIEQVQVEARSPLQETEFRIAPSPLDPAVRPTVTLLPDLATCPACLRELWDPGDRRYRYPFINCTYCGPRFSILRSLPYDRPRTTMAGFEMCPACRAEYEDPLDRRFHAQPVACPRCGPQLGVYNAQGDRLAERDAALQHTIDALRQGQIGAVKGLGGFHLMVDARNLEAVQRLRDRKHRPHKPFALMYPSLEALQQEFPVSPEEAALLQSAAAPIVLLRLPVGDGSFEKTRPLDPLIPDVGVMLPHTPLHHLLMAAVGVPVVATSGNLSGEPLCTTREQVLAKLGQVVDFVLDHDRPIARPVDDSITRVVAGGVQVLRNGRGYAPVTHWLPQGDVPAGLAVGAHLKSAIALGQGNQLILSPYIGDLDTAATRQRFQNTLADLRALYQITPLAIAHDAHPDYLSTQMAGELAAAAQVPRVPVQHHYAHALAALADHRLEPPALAIAWDGTGYGLDGTIWGGEILRIEPDRWERVAHLAPFPLPGGDAAAREPRRAALGLLYAVLGDALWNRPDLPTLQAFTPAELRLLQTALRHHLNTPLTSSMGRLFDAMASLLGLWQRCSFEGQGAIALEALALQAPALPPYPLPNLKKLPKIEGSPLMLAMVEEMVEAVLDDLANGVPPSHIAARFHTTLAHWVGAIAQYHGLPHIVLTGGCFQNRLLTEQTHQHLQTLGFIPHAPQRIPPNDGGLALGQLLALHRPQTPPQSCS